MEPRFMSPRPRTEAELVAELEAQGLHPERWSNGSQAVYGVHEHPYDKILVVASGNITFTLHTSTSRAVHLSAGDRLELPARTPHSAVAGPEGVVCLEAHVTSQARE